MSYSTIYNKPFKAYFEFKAETLIDDFDNYIEAVEWCCVRFETVGENKERFAYAKVERSGAIIWEMPERPRKEHSLPPMITVFKWENDSMK